MCFNQEEGMKEECVHSPTVVIEFMIIKNPIDHAKPSKTKLKEPQAAFQAMEQVSFCR